VVAPPSYGAHRSPTPKPSPPPFVSVNPASRRRGSGRRDESEGIIGEVTDTEILRRGDLARQEGRLIEPASAAGVSWCRKVPRNGQVDRDGTYVAART
jgi:threonine synthase